MARIVVGVTGASGVVLALKMVKALVSLDCEVDLVFSKSGIYTASLELGKEFASPQKFLSHIPEKEKVTLHPVDDIGASICSGSYLTSGMIIIPCTMTTLAFIAHGLGDNALRRAADVTLKERRPLVLVPREAPLSQIHLANMLKLAQMGASILPPIPAWYTKPQTLDDAENFIVGKGLDLLGIKHSLFPRWV